jgi:hypothetical protein
MAADAETEWEDSPSPDMQRPPIKSWPGILHMPVSTASGLEKKKRKITSRKRKGIKMLTILGTKQRLKNSIVILVI